MIRVLLISHEPQADAGVIGQILAEEGIAVDTHIVLADPDRPDTNFPDPADYDAVMAFGSFANAYDEAARVWVGPEVELIRDMLARDVPYLGVCFGGQLLAEAIGGGVERAPAGSDEIGLVTFDRDQGGVDVPIPEGPWFTWHEDRTVVPDSAEVLVRNEHAVQLFRYQRAVGTQFHPEAHVDLVQGWTEVGADHIPERTSAGELLGDLEVNAEQMRANCRRLVDWFLDEIAMVRR